MIPRREGIQYPAVLWIIQYSPCCFIRCWVWTSYKWVLCQKQLARAGTRNYIPQYLWDVITCPCPETCWNIPIQFTPRLIQQVDNESYCGLVECCLSISSRVASLVLGQSYDCHCASEATLKDKSKCLYHTIPINHEKVRVLLITPISQFSKKYFKKITLMCIHGKYSVYEIFSVLCWFKWNMKWFSPHNDSVLQQIGHSYYEQWVKLNRLNGWLIRPDLINTMRPKLNGNHFENNIFNFISVRENIPILIQISMKFDSMCQHASIGMDNGL